MYYYIYIYVYKYKKYIINTYGPCIWYQIMELVQKQNPAYAGKRIVSCCKVIEAHAALYFCQDVTTNIGHVNTSFPCK